MAFRTKIRPYVVLTIDLGTARSDKALGSITLRGQSIPSWLCNTLTVLSLGGGSLSFKLNDSNNDSIDASDGMSITGKPFSELYLTNAAQAGVTAKIYMDWTD